MFSRALAQVCKFWASKPGPPQPWSANGIRLCCKGFWSCRPAVRCSSTRRGLGSTEACNGWLMRCSNPRQAASFLEPLHPGVLRADRAGDVVQQRQGQASRKGWLGMMCLLYLRWRSLPQAPHRKAGGLGWRSEPWGLCSVRALLCVDYKP